MASKRQTVTVNIIAGTVRNFSNTEILSLSSMKYILIGLEDGEKVSLNIVEDESTAAKSSHHQAHGCALVQACSGFLHCTDNPLYAFPEIKPQGLVLNSYIHVSVSDLNITRIGLPIGLQQNRKTDLGNK
jgi:hypothetical protein